MATSCIRNYCYLKPKKSGAWEFEISRVDCISFFFQEKTDERIIELAEFLIQADVDYKLKDKTERTPIDYAAENIKPRINQIVSKR